MLRNSLNSPQLRSLSDGNGLITETIGIFKEIKMLTGAILHPPNDGLEFQVDVLTRFLISNPVFSSLTVNEIKHAFHMNQQGEYSDVYKHYNKELNGEFMGNVLLAYVEYKKQTSRRVQGDLLQLMYPKENVPAPPMPTYVAYMQVIQQDYDLYRSGQNGYIMFNLTCYNLLRKIGYIKIYSRNHWQKLYLKAMHDRQHYGNTLPKNLKDSWERNRRLDVRKVYDQINKTGEIPLHEHRMIIHHIHKKMYMHFFKIISDCGINRIFQEIEYKL